MVYHFRSDCDDDDDRKGIVVGVAAGSAHSVLVDRNGNAYR